MEDTRLVIRTRWLVALAIGVSLCPIRSTAAGPPSAIIQAQAGDPNRAAWQAFHEKDFPRSERLAREAWQKAETERDALQAAFAAANLAAAVAMRGRLDEAIEWSHRAEERLGPGRQPPVRGRILVAQGILQKVRGEDEASEQAFARARQALGGEDWSLAFAETLARGYDWEDLDASLQRMIALRDRAQGAAASKQKALALMVIGWIEGVGGAPGTPLEEARAILASSGETAALPLVDHNIGAIALWARRLDEAQAAFERGLAAARALGDRRSEVMLLDDLSLLFSQREDWPRAVAADREAGARLGAIAEDVRQGRLEDSLLLDLRRLFRGRYTHKPQMQVDLFLGLFDQLAVEPVGPESGR